MTSTSKKTKAPSYVLPERLKYHHLSPPLRDVTLSDYHQPVIIGIVSQPQISALFKIQQPLLEDKTFDLVLKQYRRVLSFPNLLRVAPRYIHLLVSKALHDHYQSPFPFANEPIIVNIQDSSTDSPTAHDEGSTPPPDASPPPITFPDPFPISSYSIVILGTESTPADILAKMKALALLSFQIPLPVLNLAKTSMAIRELTHSKIWPLSIAPKPHMAPPTIFFSPLQTLVHQFLVQHLTNTPLYAETVRFKPHWALIFDSVSYYRALFTKVPESDLAHNILPHIPTVRSLIPDHIVSFTYDETPCDYTVLSRQFPDFEAHCHNYLATIPTQFKSLPAEHQTASNINLPTQLRHCTMQAIEQTAALQCFEFNPSTYLCSNFDLFLSHEPCNMCAMAATHSRFPNVFFINQTNNGSLGSLYALQSFSNINHRFEVYQLCTLGAHDANSNPI